MKKIRVIINTSICATLFGIAACTIPVQQNLVVTVDTGISINKSPNPQLFSITATVSSDETIKAVNVLVDQVLYISEVRHSKQTEIIVIKNNSSEEADASLYMVYSTRKDTKFVIPQGTMLKPNEEYEIFNGSLDDKPKSQSWLPDMVLTHRDDTLILVTPGGVVDYYFDYPMGQN